MLVVNPKATATTERQRDILARALGSDLKVDLAAGQVLVVVRVLAELPAGPPLPQQVPALVQRLLGGAQSLTLFLAGQLAGRELTTELMLGVDQLVDVSHDLLVVHAPTVSPWPAHCGPGSVI